MHNRVDRVGAYKKQSLTHTDLTLVYPELRQAYELSRNENEPAVFLISCRLSHYSLPIRKARKKISCASEGFARAASAPSHAMLEKIVATFVNIQRKLVRSFVRAGT